MPTLRFDPTGLALFFLLVAAAMLLLAGPCALPILPILCVVACALPALACGAGYLAAARTVCKIE